MEEKKRLNNENYADLAEQAVKTLKEAKETRKVRELVSTSKLRNLLSMISDIYNELLNNSEEELNDRIKERITYLRVHFVYECGREKSVMNFVRTANILAYIQNIQGKKSEFLLFSRYMEALVAYFKFYGLDNEER